MTEHKKAIGYRRLRRVIGVCCGLVFCISVYMIVSQVIEERRAARAFEALIQQIEAQTEPTERTEEPPQEPSQAADPDLPVAGTLPPKAFAGSSEPAEFQKYDVLYAQNQDLFGWIRIAGTKVNYPVMHTPDDPEYYLHRAFDGTSSSSGVPFLDGDCYEGCGNYIVYGHHMKNGSMFAALSDYAAEAFWREHPTICFDTLDRAGEYEVLAAFYAKVYRADDANAFRFYTYTDLTEEETFNEYLRLVEDASLYDTGVTAAYGDTLLTLTTCSYHTANGRFVVVAREKGPKMGSTPGESSAASGSES